MYIYTTLQLELCDYTCTKYFTYPKSTKVYLPQNYITDNKRNALNPSYGAVIRFTRRDIKVSRTIMIITIIIGLMVIIKRILIKIIRIKPGI